MSEHVLTQDMRRIRRRVQSVERRFHRVNNQSHCKTDEEVVDDLHEEEVADDLRDEEVVDDLHDEEVVDDLRDEEVADDLHEEVVADIEVHLQELPYVKPNDDLSMRDIV